MVVPVTEVIRCIAEVLGVPDVEIDPDALLSELGLESFTAVRLRRRLRQELGVDLPLTAFLGRATARTIAAGASTNGLPESAPETLPPNITGNGTFPLTPIQLAYLVGRDPQFPLGGVATFFYFEYDRMPPDGNPEGDLRRLEDAWNRLVVRHPMLRMVVDAEVRQRVLPKVPRYHITFLDLRDVDRGLVDHRLTRLRDECSHQQLPVDRWPLFDIRAAYLPDGRTRIFVGVDVLAVDLGCWFQLMREWGALVADPASELPELPVTFADFVRRAGAGEEQTRRRARDSEYWAARADDLPAAPRLPWIAPATELGIPRFTRHPATLTELEWSGLRAAAARRGMSPTGVLLAACGLVLSRWGATEPFCLNTTLFDRGDAAAVDDTPGLEHVVGDFTSTVLVEFPSLDLTGWAGFAGYAEHVNRRFWTDLDHRSISAIEALRGRRGPELVPYPVVFTSGVGLSGSGEPPTGWLGTEVFGVSQTPQVLMDHIVWDEAGRLRIAWDVVDGALPTHFVAGLVAAHERLLRRLATDDAAWTDPALGWDPSFRPDESLEVAPFGDAGPLLDDPARAAARRHPDAPALLTIGAAISHGELADRAAGTGAALAALGIDPGELVAVAAPKGTAQVTALLGVSASGAGYVPVEPSWPTARVAALCERAGLRHALVTPGVDVTWPAGVAVHYLDMDGVLSSAETRVPDRARPDQLAYTIFTSGSTGTPKGVAIEHRAVRTTLDDLAGRFPVAPDDRMLGLSAYSFDLSVYDIFSILGAGGAIVLPDATRQRDPGHWIDLMAEHRVTLWNTAPALLEMLVEYAEVEPERARAALRWLRLVFLSADWIPVTLPDRIRALAPAAKVVSLGGATEGSIWSICFPIDEVEPTWASIPYGRALRGQSFHILDPAGRPCPVTVPGELYIGGEGLAREYVGDPEQTAQRFQYHQILRRRVYRTGDLGRWRPDGTIEFLGRVDRQIKIRGHRIELGEVESVLDRAPTVRKSVAMSMSGPDDRPRLVAFLAPRQPDRIPADDDLIDLVRANLPEFMVPSRFVWLERFPVTTNGKVDYSALKNPFRRGGSAGRPAEPESAAAESLVSPRASGLPASAPLPADGGAGWLDEVLAAAAGQGLGVSVTIKPGRLAPGEALTAAGQLSARLRERAAERGVGVIERFAPDGLLEIDLAAVAPEPAPALGESTALAAPETAPATVDGARSDEPDPGVVRTIGKVLEELLATSVEETTPFFRMGATSLTLVQAHKRLSAELDPELAVVDLFTRPTVRDLASLISQRRHLRAPTEPRAPATRLIEPEIPQPAQEPAAGPTAAARRAARRIAVEVTR